LFPPEEEKTMPSYRPWFLAAALLALSSCATDETSGEESGEEALIAADPRAGEKLSSACFTGQVNAFAEWDGGKGIILRRRVDDRVLLTFAGPCLPLQNAQAIALGSPLGRGGCMGAGDPVYFSDSPFGSRSRSPFDQGICRIRSVYEYRSEEAVEEEDEA
jgi:hypothetical protein